MKINVLNIVIDHLKTIRDDRYKQFKFDWIDFSVMFILPAAIVLLVYFSCFNDHSDVLNVITISLSIFTGLLFNLLVLIHGLITQKNKDEMSEADKKREDRKRTIVQELFKNISYLILISIFSIFLFVSSFIFRGIYQDIIYYIVYFLFLNFMLTLLMVLKRKYVIFLDQL